MLLIALPMLETLVRDFFAYCHISLINGKFAIGLRSKELKGAKCNHLLSLYPWIVVASIGLVSHMLFMVSSGWHSLFKEHHAGPVG